MSIWVSYLLSQSPCTCRQEGKSS